MSLTIPAELSGLGWLYFINNPLTSLVLPEGANFNTEPPQWDLPDLGITVHSFPLEARLEVLPPGGEDGLSFIGSGPPGSYLIQIGTNLTTWVDWKVITNVIGTVAFDDPMPVRQVRKFYRMQALE